MDNTKQLISVLAPHILKATLAITLTLAIISFFGVRITNIGRTLSEKKALTLALQQRNETTATLRTLFAIAGESDKKIADAFPVTDNVLEFVTAAEAIGNQNSMPQSLRFSEPKPALIQTSAITVVPVGYTITTNGTITTLANYLQQFEGLSYVAGIQSITITTGSPKGWEDSSSITMQGMLYTKKSL